MSLAPHVLPGSRDGQRMGDWKLVDSMIVDGLFDVYNKYHMGITAENVAKKYEVSRDKQDALALGSQQKAAAAQEAGRFKDEIVPFSHRRRRRATRSSSPPTSSSTRRPAPRRWRACARRSTRPARVTAGNASGLNDGAAGVVVMTRARSAAAARPDAARAHRQLRHRRRSTRRSWAWARCRRRRRRCSAPAGRPQDLDLLEINEAFAAQACAVNNEMGWDTSKVNVNGGAIAIGHPIGASGCRILVTLLHEMGKRNAKKGIASLCIGGGMGVAMCVARD